MATETPKMMGNERPTPEALQQMRERGGDWYAYQNHALDSGTVGHLQFLKVGQGCTFTSPPERYPWDTPWDTPWGMGWRYMLVGRVDLQTGDVQPEAR